SFHSYAAPPSLHFPYTTLFRSLELLFLLSLLRRVVVVEKSDHALHERLWTFFVGRAPAVEHLVVSADFANEPSALREVRAVLARSEEHTSELQSLRHLVCRLLL